MKFFTTATHSQGYFPALQASARRYGVTLEVVGWGQKWGGFAWKLSILKKLLRREAPDEVVVFLDAFDTVLCGPPSELLAKYRAMNSDMVISMDHGTNNKWVRWGEEVAMAGGLGKLLPSPTRYKFPNSGAFIGTAYKVLQVLSSMCKFQDCTSSVGNDQAAITRMIIETPTLISRDVYCELFGTVFAQRGNAPISVDDDIVIREGRVVIKDTGTMPCVLHAPVYGDMNLIMKELRLPERPVDHKAQRHYLRYSVANLTHAVTQEFWYVIALTLVVIVFGIAAMATTINQNKGKLSCLLLKR